MKVRPLVLITLLAFSGSSKAIDYVKDVLPVMKEHCWDCHSNEEKVRGNLALDDLEEMGQYQVGKFNIIRPGNPAESSFLEKMKLPPGDTDFMPRKGEPLPERDLAIIEEWIAKGAIIDAENLTDGEKAFMAGGEATAGEDEALKFHAWTNAAGTKIEARFLRLVDGSIDIVMKDGKSYRVPLDNLSPDSQALAKRLAGAE